MGSAVPREPDARAQQRSVAEPLDKLVSGWGPARADAVWYQNVGFWRIV